MANRTIFSDDDLRNIEKIVADLKVDGRSVMKLNGLAHSFFVNNAQDPKWNANLTAEAWVNAVVQYASIMGYEIKKKD